MINSFKQYNNIPNNINNSIMNHFYYPTNALNYTNLEVKIYVV